MTNRKTDALSAFFLLFAMLLAGGLLPLAGPEPSASMASPLSAGQGSPHSTPVLSKQQVVVSEARDISASGSDDGKTKLFLASARPLLPLPALGDAAEPRTLAGFSPFFAPFFDARAPPAIS